MMRTAVIVLAGLVAAGCAAAPEAAGDRAAGHRTRALDGMPVVLIPAGEFICGDDQGFGEPKPHPERTGAYWIDVYEVSNAQFAKFLNACTEDIGAYVDPAVPGVEQVDGTWRAVPGREDHPVTTATYRGAAAYARWVGGRLPKDLEWEKAARGTDGRIYPWGNELPDATRCNFLQAGLGDTAPVGSFPASASPYGVHDMAGNVWERVVTERGPGSIRSGSFACPMAWQMRASDRCGYAPNSSHVSVGFRVVIDHHP